MVGVVIIGSLVVVVLILSLEALSLPLHCAPAQSSRRSEINDVRALQTSDLNRSFFGSSIPATSQLDHMGSSTLCHRVVRKGHGTCKTWPPGPHKHRRESSRSWTRWFAEISVLSLSLRTGPGPSWQPSCTWEFWDALRDLRCSKAAWVGNWTMHHVSKEGLVGNTMQWELIFMGQEAGKVDAAGKQQRTAYK